MTNRSQNFYSNPAFCQKSEFLNSGGKIIRQSPVGAQTPMRYLDPNSEQSEELFDEQEFYEEVLIDDAGVVKQKKVLVVSSNDLSPSKKSRYEYIPMQEQSHQRYIVIPQNSPPKKYHRYAVIEATDDEIKHHPQPQQHVPQQQQQQYQQHHRYEFIPDSPPNKAGPRYEYTDRNNHHRYEYIQTPSPNKPAAPLRNSLATQKLHELLQTPSKSPKTVLSPQSQRKMSRDPFISPPKPKAQQKLNYTLATRQIHPQDKMRNNTAIVAPICSSPVYSETTFSQKTESWMNLSIRKPPTQITLAVAAIMMVLCGSVTSTLCFYMVSIMGRLYFLDFGIVAGFTCLVLGMMGFRTRNCYWLPNRNYISGYIVLSVFSLLTCAGLLVLLVLQPKPGTPLADMTSGAVCGISVLSLVLASAGVVASYCCKYPPPDNRVEHCVQGFVV